jgi:hypothetical protein
MVTHFSGMIPLTHGYTLLWYDTINTYGYTLLWYDTINTYGYALLWYDTINTWLNTSLV